MIGGGSCFVGRRKAWPDRTRTTRARSEVRSFEVRDPTMGDLQFRSFLSGVFEFILFYFLLEFGVVFRTLT